MLNQIFVYGTLKKGQRNEGVWPKCPLQIQPAWVRGRLFDRQDYPAMQAGDDRVLGELWTMAADDMNEVIRSLDHLEGTQGNGPNDVYHRLHVQVFDFDLDLAEGSLGDAITYLYVRDPLADGFTLMTPGSNDFVEWPKRGD